jgi:hypothetical protein
MKKRVFLTILGLLVLSCCGAFAQAQTPVVNQRQRNQQARIRQGVKSGELTRGEAGRLEAQQGKIERDKMIAKSDGKVTPKERRHLRREENRASRHIYRLKHNNRKSGA